MYDAESLARKILHALSSNIIFKLIFRTIIYPSFYRTFVMLGECPCDVLAYNFTFCIILIEFCLSCILAFLACHRCVCLSYLHVDENANEFTPLYSGGNLPSKSFRKLLRSVSSTGTASSVEDFNGAVISPIQGQKNFSFKTALVY